MTTKSPYTTRPVAQGPWKLSNGYGAIGVADADGKQVATARYRIGLYSADAIRAVPELMHLAAEVIYGLPLEAWPEATASHRCRLIGLLADALGCAPCHVLEEARRVAGKEAQ